MGRVFAIMGEKHAEVMNDPSSRTYKARCVFAGNDVQTSNGQPVWELYQEVSQTPAAMQTVCAALAVAGLKGFTPKVRDATQAYLRSRIDTPDRPATWVRLPKAWWPVPLARPLPRPGVPSQARPVRAREVGSDVGRAPRCYPHPNWLGAPGNASRPLAPHGHGSDPYRLRGRPPGGGLTS